MALRIKTRGAKITRFSTALSCANINRDAHSACGLSLRAGLAIDPKRPRTWTRLRMYGTQRMPLRITVIVSQNNSRVISISPAEIAANLVDVLPADQARAI